MLEFTAFCVKEFKNMRRLSNCSGDNLFVALISSICFLLIRVEEDTIKFLTRKLSSGNNKKVKENTKCIFFTFLCYDEIMEVTKK